MIKKISSVFITIFFLVFSFILYYANDYYKPLEKAINIYNENDGLFFDAPNKNIGFVIYPGGKVDEIAYTPLAKQLNNAGYKVEIAKFPMKLGILKPNYVEKIIENNPDVESWVVIGHSLGGTSISHYLYNNNNEKISGLVYLASYSDKNIEHIPIKTISITGTNDFIINPENFKNSKTNYSNTHKFYNLENGNHSYFAYYPLQKGDSETTITREEQINKTVEIILKEFTD